MSDDGELARAAETIDRDLRAIRGAIRPYLVRSIARDIAASSVAGATITRPQMRVLEELTRADAADGLVLKDLSVRVGLAHSTVSGIVDRLEARGLVRREPDERDHRFVRIVVGENVREYVLTALPAYRRGPLLDALRLASAEERRLMLDGLATLRRLLGAPETAPPYPAEWDSYTEISDAPSREEDEE